MMTTIFVVFDVIVVPGGDLAIGGTDDDVVSSVALVPEAFEGKRVLLVLCGGDRVETKVLGLTVHTALTAQRNIFLRIPNVVDDVDSLRGAIVSVDLEIPPAG